LVEMTTMPQNPALIADASLPDLLESNLRALHAILDEQHRALGSTLRAVSALLSDIRALGHPKSPWVQALAETRALLYVALREVITNDANATQAFPRQPAPANEAPTPLEEAVMRHAAGTRPPPTQQQVQQQLQPEVQAAVLPARPPTAVPRTRTSTSAHVVRRGPASTPRPTQTR
jgi:hypothetical protein